MMEYTCIRQNHPRLDSTRFDSAMNTRHPHRVRRGTKWQPRKSTIPRRSRYVTRIMATYQVGRGRVKVVGTMVAGGSSRAPKRDLGKKGLLARLLSFCVSYTRACIRSLSLPPSLLLLCDGFAHATGPERTTLYLTGAHRKM